jgi:hypothetical protein
MKRIVTTVLFLTIAVLSFAQTARVQVIHNSPFVTTSIGPTVDVYVNDGLLPELTAFEYRTATPFLDVPAGADLTIDVRLSPSTLADIPVASFPIGSLADGETYVVTATGIVGSIDTPFDLAINAGAKEAADDLNTVEFAVYHGSTDAPAVDVDARTVGNLIENLSYGEYSDYIPVLEGAYYIDVRANGSTDIVQTYLADLNGLAGGAATVFASGLLGNTPAFGLFAALPDGTVIELPASPVSRVQLIHNSPEPTVDVYANGGLVLADFEFRTATEFIFVPAGVPLDIQVVPAGGDPVNDDIYTEPDITLENGATYVVVASGIAGDITFPFTLFISEGREAGANADQIDLNILHGGPGVPGVDVDITGVVSTNVVSGLEYGDFTGYVSVPAAPYFLDVTVPGLITIPFFANLEGTEGASATVFASGLFGGTPALGIFAAFADGTVVEIPAIEGSAEANILHNSPAAGAELVDLYLNGAKIASDFAFRTATGFTELPADVLLNIGVAPAGSASVADTIANFRFENGLPAGEKFIVTAAGIPGDMDTPFELQIYAGAQDAATDMTKVDANVLHSSPGAPAVDVDARAVGNLLENLSYSEYTDYLALDEGLYYLDVRAAGDPNIVATFAADINGLAGGAATVFASGILGGSPAFGLFALLPDGTVVEFPATNILRAQIIHNSPDPAVDIYLNDALTFGGVEFRQATGFNFVPAAEDVNVKVVPAGGDPAMDAVLDADLTLGENGDNLIIMASGIVNDMDNPFGLQVFSGAREAAQDGGVDLLLFHGSTDAPEVDVVVDGAGLVVFDDVAYNEFSDDYVNVAADAYVLNITPSDDNENVVAAYDADLTGLEGGAGVVFASGFFNGDDPAFQVWVALPDGTTFALPEATSTNDLNGALTDFQVGPNPNGGQFDLRYALTESTELTIEIRDGLGQLVETVFNGFVAAGPQQLQINATDKLSNGIYTISINDGLGIASRRFVVVK